MGPGPREGWLSLTTYGPYLMYILGRLTLLIRPGQAQSLRTHVHSASPYLWQNLGFIIIIIILISHVI